MMMASVVSKMRFALGLHRLPVPERRPDAGSIRVPRVQSARSPRVDAPGHQAQRHVPETLSPTVGGVGSPPTYAGAAFTEPDRPSTPVTLIMPPGIECHSAPVTYSLTATVTPT